MGILRLAGALADSFFRLPLERIIRPFLFLTYHIDALVTTAMLGLPSRTSMLVPGPFVGYLSPLHLTQC